MGTRRREALHSGGQKCSLYHWPSLLVFAFSLPYRWVRQTSGVPPLPRLHLKYHLLPQVIQQPPLQFADPLSQATAQQFALSRHLSFLRSSHHTEISNTLQPSKSNAKLALLQRLHFQCLSAPRTKGTDRYLLKPAKYIHIHSVLSSSGPPWEVGICIFF